MLDELNHHLEPHGVLFAPDPSTSNRGNVGGAIGNNSCGAHSIVWGKTVDNVDSLKVVLSNGHMTELGGLTGRGPGVEDAPGRTRRRHLPQALCDS